LETESLSLEKPGLMDQEIDCIVMYGGGLTSYEAARRSIERFGHESTFIWFADTRMEDEDLYRFNRDVEEILNHEIIVFDQGMDVWEVFHKQRFLGNSRIDPCSKYLKRVPLRSALDKKYGNWACTLCKTNWQKNNDNHISIIDIDKTIIKEPICSNCLQNDQKYKNSLNKLQRIIEEEGDDSTAARISIRHIEGRVERCSKDGKFVRVVLGMDIIEDCDRLHRAKSYWRPYINWFPLATPPFKNKTRIIEDLHKIGIKEPRLYGAGFAHNNCGGFCVKAGKGQMVHLYKTLPERYLYHERKELEFQKFVGSDVTILNETKNKTRRSLTLRELRLRAESGEEFKFDKGTACACLNPTSPDLDEIAW